MARTIPTLTGNQIDAFGFLQTAGAEQLAAAMRGEVDLLALVAGELAARGLDVTTGKWIGFPAAKAAAAAHLAQLGPAPTQFHADGSMSHVVAGPGRRPVRVSIPVD